MSCRSVIHIVLLLTILIVVQSNSVELNDKEEIRSQSLVRQRRQLTVPQLVNALGIFLGQLLVFVSNLLAVLGASLPIILGALGLGGLGLALDVIVTQLAVVVGILSGRKRRAVPLPPSATDCAQVGTKVNAAQTSSTTIANLVPVAKNLNVTVLLTAVQTGINSVLTLVGSVNPSLTAIQSSLNGILTNLNNAVGQIQSTINTLVNTIFSNSPIIFQGLASPLSCISELGTSLVPLINAVGVTQFGSFIKNVVSAQNVTNINLSLLDLAFFAISNATVALLQYSTLGFGNLTGQGLISCIPNPLG